MTPKSGACSPVAISPTALLLIGIDHMARIWWTCELASTGDRCTSSEEYSETIEYLITSGAVTETRARTWIFPPRFVINVPNGRVLLAICILATAHLTHSPTKPADFPPSR